MLHFRTIVEVEPSPEKIDYWSDIFLIGSCFSQNMGDKLDYYCFSNTVNPFGVVFNPVSISKSLQRYYECRMFTEQDLSYNNGLWFSYDTSAGLAEPEKSSVLKKLNKIVDDAHYFTRQADFLIITFGSAWVYELKDTSEIVANCHKVPGDHFNKRLLTVNEIVDSYQQLFHQIGKEKPACKVFFTVSPVRHWKDGAIENQRSKSTLILAVQQLVNQYVNACYFPAYEIVMDDLRDYRFYADDKLHPDKQAIDYIWESFKKACISESCYLLMSELEKLQSAVAHKPFNPLAEAHQRFLKVQLNKIKELESSYDFIDMSKMRKIFTDQLLSGKL